MARRLELCLSIAKVPRSPDQPPGLLNLASRFRKNAAIDRRTIVVGFSTSQVFGINRQLFHPERRVFGPPLGQSSDRDP